MILKHSLFTYGSEGREGPDPTQTILEPPSSLTAARVGKGQTPHHPFWKGPCFQRREERSSSPSGC